MHYRTKRPRRRGNVILLTAVLMVIMMAFLAFAIDLGYLYNVRTEMQRTADAAAIAGACDEVVLQVLARPNPDAAAEKAVPALIEFIFNAIGADPAT